MKFAAILFLVSYSLSFSILKEHSKRTPSSVSSIERRALSDLITSCASNETLGRAFQLCVHYYPESDRKSIAYYIHGGGGSPWTWQDNNNFQYLREEMKLQKLIPPIFVSISFGPHWALKQFASDSKSPLLLVFNQIQQEIEKKLTSDGTLQFGSVENRMIFGESIGGMNTILAVSLGDNKIKYRKAAILCPAIFTISPFSTDEEVDQYVARARALGNHGITRANVVGPLRNFFKTEFPSPKIWEEYDLVKLLKNSKSAPQQIYISSNKDDLAGLREGALLLFEQVKLTHENVIYKDLPGPHCKHDFKSLAQFLGVLRN